MDKTLRNIIIFIGIATIFGSGAAEWFFLNVILGPIMFFVKILEWASETPDMTIGVLIISLLVILFKQKVGDLIQSRLGL